jgi:hypothetical protein
MRFVLILLSCIAVSGLTATAATAGAPAATDSAATARLLDTIPLQFEQALGQQKHPGSAVRWSAHGFGYSFGFTDQATILRAGGRALSLSFPGAKQARFEGADASPVATNYFVGHSYRSVPGFRRLRRAGVYPGIDVVYYGHGRQLEYDFEIAPGADPSPIRMRFEGADGLRLNENGEIALKLGPVEVEQRLPVVYQRTREGKTSTIAAAYRLDKNGDVRLTLGRYNPAEALVVDPVLTYTEFFSSTTGANIPVAVAHDDQGFVYLAGYTYATDLPLIGSTFQIASAGDSDVFVVQLNLAASGGAVLYTTYLGGSGAENLQGMTVDANGVMYLTGSTQSGDFPTTSTAYTSAITGGTHVFVAALDPFQSGASGLTYSTVLGGSGTDDEGTAITVFYGKIYVAGFTNSTDFPNVNAQQAAYDFDYDAFAAEIDPTQSGAASLLVSTFLGGSADDKARSIAVDSSGNVYVAGYTQSVDFPTTPNAYQPNYIGDQDIFLAELNFNTATLVYASYLGGSSIDEAKKILIDSSGNVALTGYTLSPDFPVTQNAFQTHFGGRGNAFLTIVDVTKAAQGLVYSSYYGGSGGEVAYDMALDAYGRYYLGGYTLSPNLPVTPDALNSTSADGGGDGFLAVLNPSAGLNGLVYGTYITGPGAQIVYGVDVINPPSLKASSGSIQLLAVGQSTSNVFPSNEAQNPNPGNTATFFFVMQFEAPASSGDARARRREHTTLNLPAAGSTPPTLHPIF